MANGPDDTSSGEGSFARTTTVDMAIGRRIGARRAQLGLSVAELARLALVSVDQLTRFETGLERPPPGVLLRLCTPLECSIRLLFTGVDKSKNLPDEPKAPEQLGVASPAEHAAIQQEVCNDILEIVHIYGRLPSADRRLVLDFARALGEE